jgi:hypothetical protein
MIQRNRCHRCHKRLTPGPVRCVGCGTEAGAVEAAKGGRSTRRWAGLVAVVLTVAALIAVGLSDRYMSAVSDWYTDMVIRFLPGEELSFLAVPDDQQAFRVCARSVVRRIEAESSVATFPGLVGGAVDSLGEGRFRIDSFVDEASEGGAVHRRTFRCLAHFDGRRWRVEDLVLQTLAAATITSPATSPARR